MNNVLLKNILVILGLLTVAFAGYYMYSQKGATVLSTDPTDDLRYQNMLLNTQVFIQRRQELNQIQLDTGLFEDAKFRTLQSHTRPLQQIDTGRNDPFAEVTSTF